MNPTLIEPKFQDNPSALKGKENSNEADLSSVTEKFLFLHRNQTPLKLVLHWPKPLQDDYFQMIENALKARRGRYEVVARYAFEHMLYLNPALENRDYTESENPEATPILLEKQVSEMEDDWRDEADLSHEVSLAKVFESLQIAIVQDLSLKNLELLIEFLNRLYDAHQLLDDEHEACSASILRVYESLKEESEQDKKENPPSYTAYCCEECFEPILSKDGRIPDTRKDFCPNCERETNIRFLPKVYA